MNEPTNQKQSLNTENGMAVVIGRGGGMGEIGQGGKTRICAFYCMYINIKKGLEKK